MNGGGNMQEPQNQFGQKNEKGSTGYQGCVVININGNRYTATSNVFTALSDILSIQLKNASESCSNIFKQQSVSEEVLIKEINEKISNIFQLSLDLSDPFHRLKLEGKVEFFHLISKSKSKSDSNKKKNDVSTGATTEIDNITEKIENSLRAYNPQLVDDNKIKEDLKSLIGVEEVLDPFDFDFETVYKKVLKIASDNANKGYYAIIECLKTLEIQLEQYKRQSKINFFEDDPLTPLDMEFKFAIYDENGRNMSYGKEQKGGFEFFIERGGSQGYYDICCVIHDWNNALVDSKDIREESDYVILSPDNTINIIPTSPIIKQEQLRNFQVSGDVFFEYYKLARYRKYAINSNCEKNSFYGYQEYTKNGGKIIIKSGVRNYFVKGEIVLSGCRDTQHLSEIKYTFYVSLRENSQAFTNQNTSNNNNGDITSKQKIVLDRNLRCPYCAQELGIKRWQKRKRYCNGGKTQIEKGIACKNNHYLDKNFFDASDNVSAKFCFGRGYQPGEPECPLFLPENYAKNVSGVVSLIGKAGSGKSVFISNFFGMTKKDMKGNINWNSTIGPFISNSSCSFYMPNDDWEKAQKKFFKDDSSGTAYSDYLSVLYENGPKRSPENKNSALIHLPFILEMRNINNGVTSYMSFFDCPGEYIYNQPDKDTPALFKFQSDSNANLHPVSNSDAYILFIDPTDSNDATDKIDGRIENATHIVDELKKVIGDVECKQRVVAVVFSKFDVWLSQLTEKRNQNVDEFLSIVRCSAPVEGKNRVDYQGSKTQTYIDACSNAIRTYLYSAEGIAFDALEKSLNGFGSHKYFLASALGRAGALRFNGTGKTPSILYQTKSNYNVDVVALWLAVQLGIIK